MLLYNHRTTQNQITGGNEMKKYTVRLSYDKEYKRVKEFNFDSEENANSFFDQAVKRAERIGFGTIALWNGDWKIKSARIE